MSEWNHQPPPGDALDRAVAAVRGQATPEPPADLTVATLAAVTNRLQQAEADDSARRRRRVWIMRGMSFGGLAACLAVAVLWGGGATAAESLRAALDNQQKAKSFRAVIRTTMGADGKPAEQKLYSTGSKVRIEFGDQVIVGDAVANRLVMLDSKAKVARVAEGPFPKGAGGHPDVAEAVRKMLAKEGAEDLGERFLDGRRVHGYRLKGLKLDQQTADVTYTVDGKRQFPVRLEMSLSGGALAMTQTIDYLGFDEDLDPKLFALDIPDGYKREELKIPGAALKKEPSPAPGQLAESPKRERTRPVSLTLAAEAMAAAPCMVVTNTQRLLPGRPELTVRMLVRGKQFRLEFVPPGRGDAVGALVVDVDADRSLHLNFGEKTAKFEKRTGPKPATFPDLVAGFRQLKDEDGEPVGEEKVGDVTARVFTLKSAAFIGAKHATAKVWLDPITNLPLKVVAGDGKMELRFEKFEWPATLSDSLFSLTPPKGYTVGEFVPPATGPAKK